MRRIILYIATSIDGYIATPDGGVEWLNEIPNPTNEDHGYKELLASIDTVLMGGKTYHEIIGFGIPWPYKDKKLLLSGKSFFTHKKRVESSIRFNPFGLLYGFRLQIFQP